ncbi:MAG: PilZ domain-containing protein [Afipia felis]|nr:PilZ domain-containing protein [Afipia felis]
MTEKRIAQRRRILKAGFIETSGGINCFVRNISETGASIEVSTPLFIPDRFTLHIPSDQLSRRCHIVWRNGKRFGLAFE